MTRLERGEAWRSKLVPCLLFWFLVSPARLRADSTKQRGKGRFGPCRNQRHGLVVEYVCEFEGGRMA